MISLVFPSLYLPYIFKGLVMLKCIRRWPFIISQFLWENVLCWIKYIQNDRIGITFLASDYFLFLSVIYIDKKRYDIHLYPPPKKNLILTCRYREYYFHSFVFNKTNFEFVHMNFPWSISRSQVLVSWVFRVQAWESKRRQKEGSLT